ncbi:MAG: DUF5011 domain-containing protein, partial [Verrucomicrobiota bacterium]
GEGENGLPVVSLEGPALIVVEAGTDFDDPGASAADPEDGVLPVVVMGAIDVFQLGQQELLYGAMDSQGQEAMPQTRVVWVKDSLPPSIQLNGPALLDHEFGDVYQDQGVTPTDSFDSSPRTRLNGWVNVNRLGTYAIRYFAEDDSGNRSETLVRTVVVKDTRPPVMTLLGDGLVYAEVGEPYVDAGASAVDGIDGQVRVTAIGAVNVTLPGVYTLAYSAKDASGNQAPALTRTVIVRDTKPPEIGLNGANKILLQQGELFEDPGVLAIDAHDGAVPFLVEGQDDINLPGTNVLNYSAVDLSGNRALPVTRIVVVAPLGDYESPVISLNGEPKQTIAVGEDYVELGADAVDNLDGAVDVAIIGSVNTNAVGVYTLVYTAQDQAGNAAKPVSRVVLVMDSLPPVTTLLGPEVLRIEVGAAFNDPGASAVDNLDLNPVIKTIGTVDTSQPGNFSLTYFSIDASGNRSLAVVRTVLVRDTQPPIIKLQGYPRVEVLQGSNYTDSGAIANDLFDGQVSVVTKGLIDTSLTGVQILTYTAKDASGNEARPVTRIVRVVNDTPPVITLNGGHEIYLEVGDVFEDPGASVIDDRDTDLQVVVAGQVDTSREGRQVLI